MFKEDILRALVENASAIRRVSLRLNILLFNNPAILFVKKKSYYFLNVSYECLP